MPVLSIEAKHLSGAEPTYATQYVASRQPVRNGERRKARNEETEALSKTTSPSLHRGAQGSE